MDLPQKRKRKVEANSNNHQQKTTRQHVDSARVATGPSNRNAPPSPSSSSPKKKATTATTATTKKKKKPEKSAKKAEKVQSAKKGKDPTKLTTEINRVPKSEDMPAPPIGVSHQALSPNVTLSACLLVRDDNDIITEWLAYHYHTLRMRRLIVAVDPNSETSPSNVLEAWRDYMDIDLWTDDMYMPKQFLETGIPPSDHVENITKFGDINHEEMLAINVHRYRQKFFLGRCYRKFKQEHRSFVLHIDTDEYIVPNKLLRKEKKVKMRPIREPGSILTLVQQLVESDAGLLGYPCISMLRLLFGSVENEEDEWAPMPSDFDRNSFETLRWRYHGSTLNKKKHGHPKVLVDVSKIPERFLSKKVVYSIHRPFAKFCRGQGESDYKSFDKFPITANHYLGSWERYNARNDTRRSWSMYNDRATVNSGEDTWVQGWLEGFIKDVGHDQAMRLLGQRYLKKEVATITK